MPSQPPPPKAESRPPPKPAETKRVDEEMNRTLEELGVKPAGDQPGEETTGKTPKAL